MDKREIISNIEMGLINLESDINNEYPKISENYHWYFDNLFDLIDKIKLIL